ncbi:MAG: DEAD/DEAH box helicase [Candidatus Diapherotrites archaeon]
MEKKFISHPLLKEDVVESRLFQEVLAARVLDKGNSLVVAPTALGKTVVAALVSADLLHKFPEKKVLFLAPTKPLAVQHQKSFRKFLKIEPERISLLTGTVPQKQREAVWRESAVICATPQTIENDLVSGRIQLKDVSLTIFDEAHRAVGDYSYVFIAKMLAKQNPEHLILALTASPGSEEEGIQDVCKNLFIKNIEVKTPKDEDVEPYTHEIELRWQMLDLPPEFLEIKKHFERYMKEQLEALKKMGCAKTSNVRYYSQRRLLELQSDIRRRIISHGKTQPSLFAASSRAAALMKIAHAHLLLETQGTAAVKDYFDKMKVKATHSGASKALKSLLKDESIMKAFTANERLFNEGLMHPKLAKLSQILKSQFKEHPESRVLVFNHYRDSINSLERYLKQFPELKVKRFVGQATKEKDKGMSQKEQISVIRDFEAGEYNTLLCSSVAEEGLDIPAVDLVVFFEPVPSEIRSIQRRGRTGRFGKGKVIVLMAKNTRDEAFYWSSIAKEKRMHETLKTLRKEVTPVLQQQATLSEFVEAKDSVLIYADSREQASPVTRLLQEKDALVKVRQLEVGDFVLSDDIVVERKTIDDFLSSLLDGRLFQQLVKMAENYSAPLVLVEGKREEMFSLRNVHRNAIIGALTSIACNYRIPVLFTDNAEETAEYLFLTAKREQLGKGKGIRLRLGRKGLTLAEQQQFLIEGLPSVGPTLAKNLLKQFGSVKKLFNASEERLQKAEGIGEKKAKEIRKLLESEFKDE